MVPILCRISISAKEYVGHIQIYVVPIFIPLSSRSCGLGITTIVEGVSILLSLTKFCFMTISKGCVLCIIVHNFDLCTRKNYSK